MPAHPTWRFIRLSGEWIGNLRGKMAIRFLLTVVFVAGLSACSVVRNYVADLDQTGAVSFCEQKRSNPAVGVLKGKLAIVSVEEITPDMLALDEVPTAQDVEAIRVLARDQRECRDRTDAVAKDHWPTQSATRKGLALKYDLVTAELLKRKISFGNANRLYQEAALDAEGLLTEDRKDQLAQARQQEVEAWRTIGDGIRAIAGSQKPEPTADPCTWSGNSVDCGGN